MLEVAEGEVYVGRLRIIFTNMGEDFTYTKEEDVCRLYCALQLRKVIGRMGFAQSEENIP